MLSAGRDRFWGYAATFGAMWGAVEITVGSFVHTIRIPFTGVLLGAVGAALLITLRTVYPKRGVLVAAGVVCAGIKMLSPAGAIIGPVVAILVESAIVELICLPFGAGLGSAVLSGTAVSLWSVTQKLITQVLFYGSPVLSIYTGILKRAEQWLGLPKGGGAWVAIIFVSILAVIGSLLGWLGHRTGVASRERLTASRAL